MELLLLALGVLGLAAIGGAMAGVFDPKERVRRLLRHARTFAIRDARDGQVAKIEGRVRPIGETLRAPLTERPCVYWEIEVTAWQGTRPLGTRRANDRRDFLLEDGSGRAIISLERAAISARVDARWGHPEGLGATPEILYELDLAPREWPVTYTEAVIAVGEMVAASGRCAWEADPDPGIAAGYRDLPMRLSLRAGAGEVVVVVGSEKEPRWLG